ncbi:protein MICROTUBULE BINDING PROTEIN 2C [Euphorbia lathyris]|uniref:protein MICROTUBULE BINDING PROTEIN 2C n=1 Tax=Euphorbia lathyris TaxID=212925 RepID=UPI0033142350
MYDPQHFLDLQENPNFGDHKSWLSGDDNSSPILRRTDSQLSAHTAVSSTTGAGGNVERDLFNDLVEMVPLVESLIHRKANSSFTRRGSVTYTKTPSRDSLYRKMNDPRGRNVSQSIQSKKRREHGDRDNAMNAGSHQDADNLSVLSSRALVAEEIEELVTLREQVEDLKRKLLEKDELLKSAEIVKNEMDVVQGKLNELKHLVAEKESLIKCTQVQLSDAKIKLADKQAALEKVQWEAMTASKKVEKLQEDQDSLQGDISSLMVFFEGLTDNNFTRYAEDYDIKPSYLEYRSAIDNLDEEDMQKMEEAREAYVAAVSYAKEKQDEESIVAAASARRHLKSIVFKSDFSNGGVSRSSY